MGRTNRSRKRTSAMNNVKRKRYAAKELIRLKKTLGLIDAQGKDLMMEVGEVSNVKTPKELKKEKKIQENDEMLAELLDNENPGEVIEVVNEKTGKTHKYNTKTMKDQHGSHPVWFKPRKTAKKLRKLNHARKQRFKQAWTTINVPL